MDRLGAEYGLILHDPELRRGLSRLGLRKLVASLIVAVVLLGAGSAQATPLAQAASADPIVVVENFLAARNARDPVGAAGWFASPLAIDDGDTRSFRDHASATEWLRGLTDAYVIEPLIRPDVEGDKVAWTERLTPRTLEFPESIAASEQVDVLVIVADGRITEIRARYPVAAIEPAVQVAGRPAGGEAPSATAPPSPVVLVFGTALGLIGLYILMAGLAKTSRLHRGNG